ncbi:MAG: DUF2231 domain-containing protein [Candidatus Neomarinimicrobiota bacterium]
MYTLYNIHPLLIHFPIALLAVGLVLDFAGVFFRRNDLISAGWYNLQFAVAAVIFSIASGLLADTRYGSLQEPFPLHTAHGPLMLLVGLMTIILMLIRFNNKGAYPQNRNRRLAILAGQLLLVALLFWGAHLGAVLGDGL